MVTVTSAALPPKRTLARHGYGGLLFDRAGEGELNIFGWNGEPDLTAAIAFLRHQPDVDPDRIGGFGLSVGGELLMLAAAHTSGLRAVASEGAGIRSMREHLHTPGLGKVQRWFSPVVLQTAAVAVLYDTAPPDDLEKLVARVTPRLLLLIRASFGHTDESLNRVYRTAAGSTATLWEVAQDRHAVALAARPAEYERRVLGFLDRALLAHPGESP